MKVYSTNLAELPREAGEAVLQMVLAIWPDMRAEIEIISARCQSCSEVFSFTRKKVAAGGGRRPPSPPPFCPHCDNSQI